MSVGIATSAVLVALLTVALIASALELLYRAARRARK